jgi:type IV pilus assembly protein PilQ
MWCWHTVAARYVLVTSLLAGLLTGVDRPALASPPARFSMEFRNADIRDVLRALGQENNLNVVFGDDVQGNITLSFRDVTLQGALEAILRIQNLSGLQEGNILRIVRLPFSAVEEQLVTATIPIKYADVEELSGSIKQLLSSSGRLTVDKRTNTIVVRDIQDNINRIRNVAMTLDERLPQVVIEAQIVEVDVNVVSTLGIRWGGNEGIRNGLGTVGMEGTSETGGFSPAAVGPGSGGAVGFSFGNVPDTLPLDQQLTALQNSGRGRILSSPKFLIQNNKEAKIATGLTIPVLTSAVVSSGVATPEGAQGGQATTGVHNIDVTLSLTVTPHVTTMGQINLKLHVEKKDADFARQVRGIPTLITREASTEMIVRDAETLVIGGIYEKTDRKLRAGASHHWFGWLFKQDSPSDNQSELLIFVTPHLYHEGDSADSSLASP